MAKTLKLISRGVRNNNPGNIRKSDAYQPQGLADQQIDPAFFTFKDPIMGIRFIARVLITYQDKHMLKTVRDFIGRYAPPGDRNPTDAYAANVARSISDFNETETKVNDPIDVHKYEFLRPMVEGIITQETGAPWKENYTDAQLDKAILMAGVQPPVKSVAATRTVKSAVVASAATVVTAVSNLPTDAIQEQLSPFQEAMPWIKTVLLGCVLIGLVRIIWLKYDDRKKGV